MERNSTIFHYLIPHRINSRSLSHLSLNLSQHSTTALDSTGERRFSRRVSRDALTGRPCSHSASPTHHATRDAQKRSSTVATHGSSTRLPFDIRGIISDTGRALSRLEYRSPEHCRGEGDGSGATRGGLFGLAGLNIDIEDLNVSPA